MIGILVELAISWLLLFIIEKKNILSLGFLPVLRRIKQFFTGFLITSFLCVCVQLLESFLISAEWTLNNEIDRYTVWKMFFWDFKSVVFEELIFRGALLYILIKRIGTQKGILISAVAFGIYHWFSLGIFGNLIPMLIIFLGSGLMGYAWAWAFSKTKSIAMPIGFHLGWNFTLNTIFSKGPLGNGILLLESDEIVPGWFSLIGLCLVPIIVFFIVKFFLTEAEMK